MNRRQFSAGAACVLGPAVLGLPGAAQAQRRLQEGKDFRRLQRPLPTEAGPGQIEVIEFFSYACRFCNAFEPKLVAWIERAPKDVVFRRVPVGFRDALVPQQRLFYTLEAMDRLDLHPRVFEAIHEHRQPLQVQQEMLAWAGAQGLDPARFGALYNSPEISAKARRATQLHDAYYIDGVPALAIAGRYYTDGTMAGGLDRLLQVADYLLAEARQAR